MDSSRVRQILSSLTGEYGSRNWQQRDSPISVLVQTILSQNTSDTNSRRAYDSLLASFDNWESVATTSADEIAASIRTGGLGEIKAKRIKQALGEIQQKRGELELSFLNRLPLAEARDWLKQLPGVGSKTANCVLLFSLGRPALPVDTHVFRVAKRLGLVDSKASVEKAHMLLESLVPAEDVYQFHILLIEHGRRTCKAQRPRCTLCILRRVCPSYERLMGEPSGRQR
ncbi:endonuclease III domain-containing protein [Chloroflexota bacterium]